FMKSLDIDHARDGEVMVAYAMNGEQLPLVNGFPLRLVVPGWYATYWVKMVPINKMVPRSFVTNIPSGQKVKAAAPTTLRGIAFGGDCAVAAVDYSIDRGQSWRQAQDR